ncbi:MAG: LysE family transporter [Eubacteriales bacterium]
MILIFLSALTIGFSGAIMPGSLLTYTIKQSLSFGPRSGFIITLGHAFLELILLVLIFLGLDIVLKSDTAQIVIGILGGILLIYMGIDMIINSIKNKVSVKLDNEKSSNKNLFISGMLISAANPYFLLWWAVIGLGFVINSYETLGYMGVVVYYIGHIMADFIWYGVISIIIGTTRKFIKDKPYRILIAMLGCLLVFFGGSFLFNAIKSLI